MEFKSKPKTASSSAINGDSGVQLVKNTDSFHHWSFLDEIDAPMWADLTLCGLTNDNTDELWFNVCHQFHQCSSSQLLSTSSIGVREPRSPKMAHSVSKLRGKSYKKSYVSIGSNDKKKPVSKTVKLKENDHPKATLSHDNGPKISNSGSSSLVRQDHESGSNLTSDHSERKTSALLSSLRSNLRESWATRPAARVVNGGTRSEGCKSSSGKKPVCAAAENKLKSSYSEPLTNKAKFCDVKKATAVSVRSLSNKRGNNTVSSNETGKGKIQQYRSFGKVLMQRKVNEENQMVSKGTEKVGVGKGTVSLTVIKETASRPMAKCGIAKSGNKAAQSVGNIRGSSKQSLAQNRGGEKLIGLKEKTKNRSRDKDIVNSGRKVYFR